MRQPVLRAAIYQRIRALLPLVPCASPSLSTSVPSTGPTRHISARTYLRLRFLDAPTLQSAMGGILTPEEVAALLSRRDSMLAFFDGLVADKGYGSIVLEA